MKDLTPITDAEIRKGTKILVRSDLDVPINAGKITDPFRLAESGRTISFLKEKGARVVVIGHIGRSSGTLIGVSLALPIGHMFVSSFDSSYLNTMQPGEVALLENIRKDEREVLGDISFAEELARSFEIYVFDAFAVSHRKHTSVVHLPKLLKTYGGIRFTEEIREIRHARKIKERFFILGGGKAETKVQFLKRIIEEGSLAVAGGVVLNTILKAEGYEIGKSVVADSLTIQSSKGIFNSPMFVKPKDLIVERPDGVKRKTSFEDVEATDIIVDIGPESVQDIIERLSTAVEKAIVWNGPLGWIEKGYNQSTINIGKKVIENDSLKTIIGGGDTHSSLLEILPPDSGHFFVSTGGGAMLHFFLNGTVPILES